MENQMMDASIIEAKMINMLSDQPQNPATTGKAIKELTREALDLEIIWKC